MTSVWKNRNIIVTGAAGFIGSHLSERLLDEGAHLTGIDDLSTGQKKNIEILKEKGAKIYICSLLDMKSITHLFDGVDYVFHQAAIPSVQRSVSDPVKSHMANIQATFNTLELCRLKGVGKLVYAASSSAYGDITENRKNETMAPRPLSPYSVQKLMGEYYCKVYNKVYGLPTISLRYFNVYGPRQDPFSPYSAVIPKFIMNALDNQDLVIYGDGNQTRNFTFIDDVVDSNLLAATSEPANGHVLNISSGVQTSINELAKSVIEITGSQVEIVYRKKRDGDIQHSHGNIDLSQELIGFKPNIKLQDGLQNTFSFYKKSRDTI